MCAHGITQGRLCCNVSRPRQLHRRSSPSQGYGLRLRKSNQDVITAAGQGILQQMRLCLGMHGLHDEYSEHQVQNCCRSVVWRPHNGGRRWTAALARRSALSPRTNGCLSLKANAIDRVSWEEAWRAWTIARERVLWCRSVECEAAQLFMPSLSRRVHFALRRKAKSSGNCL